MSNLIAAYRTHGHRCAHIDPLEPDVPELQLLKPAHWGFVGEDLDQTFDAGSLGAAVDELSLREIDQLLRALERFETNAALVGDSESKTKAPA